MPSIRNSLVAQSPPTVPRIPIEYVTVREAAIFTGLSVPTLTAMRRLGFGPDWVRASARRVVYEIAALRAYMSARTVKPTLG